MTRSPIGSMCAERLPNPREDQPVLTQPPSLPEEEL
jgi:hypothetical protein